MATCTYCDEKAIRETTERTRDLADNPIKLKLKYCREHVDSILHKGLELNKTTPGDNQ